MKTLYLHVGYHKTATTAIQTALYNNSELLKTIDYHYLQSIKKNHGMRIHSAFCDNPYQYKPLVKKNFTRKQIDDFIEKSKNNIIDEVHNSNCTNFIISGEAISELAQKNLVNLKRFINEELQVDKVVVILSTRDPLSYYNSFFQQKSKTGINLDIFNANLYSEKILKLMNVFGKENLRIYPFEEASQSTFGPIGYFCKQIGIQEEIVKQIDNTKVNTAISNKAVDLLVYINNCAPYIKHGIPHKKRKLKDTKVLQNITGDKFILDVETQKYIIQNSKTDRAWLAKNFGISYNTQEIQKPFKITFDETYYQDMLAIYPQVSPFIQGLILNYLEEKKLEYVDYISQKTLTKLLRRLREENGSYLDN